MVPAVDVEKVRRWALTRYPVRHLNEMRPEIVVGEASIDLYECRPPWRREAELDWSRRLVVRFAYTAHDTFWSILWTDSTNRLHPYVWAEPSERLGDLLRVVDDEPHGIFWG